MKEFTALAMLADNKDVAGPSTQQTVHQEGTNTKLERGIAEIRQAINTLQMTLEGPSEWERKTLRQAHCHQWL